MRYVIILPGLLAGRFDFERISKSVLRLLRTARIKTRIRIYVQHQYLCSTAGWILHSGDNDNNKACVTIIGKFYVILHSRRRRDGT